MPECQVWFGWHEFWMHITVPKVISSSSSDIWCGKIYRRIPVILVSCPKVVCVVLSRGAAVITIAHLQNIYYFSVPGRHQAIAWLNGDSYLNWTYGRNFRAIKSKYFFFHVNAFENIVCKMAAFLFRPQCMQQFVKAWFLTICSSFADAALWKSTAFAKCKNRGCTELQCTTMWCDRVSINSPSVSQAMNGLLSN